MRSTQWKSSTLILHVQYSTQRPNAQWTICKPIFITNPFSPCQVGGLSILPSDIRFPLSPRSQLISDHRSCALLISISCRFHFPRWRQRENKRWWSQGGTNTLSHHHWGYLLPSPSKTQFLFSHKLVHTVSHIGRNLCPYTRLQFCMHTNIRAMQIQDNCWW